MKLFSERYGYIDPNDVIIREQITEPVLNSILNWWDIINSRYTIFESQIYNREKIERHIWMFFLNRRYDSFGHRGLFIRDYLLDEDIVWYKKLDLIEAFCIYASIISPKADISIDFLNKEFERHNFAYRVVKNRIIEITSKEEIESIHHALTTPIEGVKTHLQTALKLMSASQDKPDYRNSIKESISAVECLCRDITRKSSLDVALKHLIKKGISINPQLQSGFENLYYYTNDKRTGVRHALMDDSNAPTSAEATYMLVICSAFINYVNMKIR
jgi:hypothetical protein